MGRSGNSVSREKSTRAGPPAYTYAIRRFGVLVSIKRKSSEMCPSAHAGKGRFGGRPEVVSEVRGYFAGIAPLCAACL